MMGEKWVSQWAETLEEGVRSAGKEEFLVPEGDRPVLGENLIKARSFSKEGKLHEEIGAYEKALAEGIPPFFWVYRNLAKAYWQAGKREAAIKLYEENLTREEVPLIGASLLAGHLREMGYPGKASQIALDAIRNCPSDNAPAKVASGQLYESLGQARDAVQCYREALSIQENHRMAQRLLARILMSAGDLAEALQLLNQLCDRPGVRHTDVVRRALCFCRLNPADPKKSKLLEEAATRLSKSTEKEANYVQDHFMLALLYLLGAREEEADQAMKRGLQTLPKARDRSSVMRKVEGRLSLGPLKTGVIMVSMLYHLRHFKGVRRMVLHALERQILGSSS